MEQFLGREIANPEAKEQKMFSAKLISMTLLRVIS